MYIQTDELWGIDRKEHLSIIVFYLCFSLLRQPCHFLFFSRVCPCDTHFIKQKTTLSFFTARNLSFSMLTEISVHRIIISSRKIATLETDMLACCPQQQMGIHYHLNHKLLFPHIHASTTTQPVSTFFPSFPHSLPHSILHPWHCSLPLSPTIQCWRPCHRTSGSTWGPRWHALGLVPFIPKPWGLRGIGED